jgi:hypothetical protein
MVQIIDNMTYPPKSGDPFELKSKLWPLMMAKFKERIHEIAVEANAANDDVVISFTGSVGTEETDWEVSVDTPNQNLKDKIEYEVRNIQFIKG